MIVMILFVDLLCKKTPKPFETKEWHQINSGFQIPTSTSVLFLGLNPLNSIKTSQKNDKSQQFFPIWYSISSNWKLEFDAKPENPAKICCCQVVFSWLRCFFRTPPGGFQRGAPQLGGGLDLCGKQYRAPELGDSGQWHGEWKLHDPGRMIGIPKVLVKTTALGNNKKLW